MTSVIEKVARALCEDTLSRWRSPIALQAEPWREFIPAARAVLEAIREPSEGMLALHGQMAGNELCWGASAATLSGVWQAMIDAALREGE